MYSGEFLENFFTERGPFTENAQGEAAVLCPFPHDKGVETRPSAHVNVKKSVFHCKTCFAEGRFDNGGLSEVGFVAEIFGITYDKAVQFLDALDSAKDNEVELWIRQQEGLWANKDAMELLQTQRGLIKSTVQKYRLGYPGDGITYPVFVYGQLCDVRTYMPNETPKMRSRKGASPLLFPFDHWRHDTRPTFLMAGENDTLLCRQFGYNALTVTAGEGSFPKIFLNLFRDREVYVCYDCDDAGKKSARRVAFLLYEVGAVVRIVDLGLPGTKEDKDFTDFMIKDGKGKADFEDVIKTSILYSGEMLVEDKNIEYPLVNLWDVPEGRLYGKRVSARVMLSGKYDAAMQAPTAVEWKCRGAQLDAEGKSPCHSCRLSGVAEEKETSGWWTVDENLKDIMEVVDVTEQQQTKNLNRLMGRPDKCPNGYWKIRARQSVYKVVFTPDVETEDILTGFRAVEQYGYTVGLNLEDGARYRAFFRPYAHPLDGQRVFMVVDRVEESDNAVNTFQITPEIQESLKVFQGPPTTMMRARAEMAKDIVGLFAPEQIVYAVDLMYHSPLRFKFRGKELKGYPEGLVIGDTRTGKSDTAIQLLRYYGIGNHTSVKRATTAGLLGGADKLPNGGFKVTWGTIPRNNKGLVFLDEMSDCALDVIASLTDMRSSGIASVHKIAKGKAPANTRMLWISNPRKGYDGQNMSVGDYPTGIQIVLDLVGATEDIARFDFIMLVPENEIKSPIEEAPVKAHAALLYKQLIYWAWSRSADQVLWDKGVEEYVWQVSQELNEKYNTDIKFFGAEAWKKLARIAVAVAGSCFACNDDGSAIVVAKSHVDWASNFLRNCYDNAVFRLAEYVRDRRIYSETNESVNTIVAGMCRTYPTVIKTLLGMTTAITKFNLQAVSGLDNNDFNGLISDLMSNYLITVDSHGFRHTQRLKKAVDLYRAEYANTRMIPLSEQGGLPV